MSLKALYKGHGLLSVLLLWWSWYTWASPHLLDWERPVMDFGSRVSYNWSSLLKGQTYVRSLSRILLCYKGAPRMMKETTFWDLGIKTTGQFYLSICDYASLFLDGGCFPSNNTSICHLNVFILHYIVMHVLLREAQPIISPWLIQCSIQYSLQETKILLACSLYDA